MNIRPSPIAGSWYPGQASSLTRDLDRYLNQVETTASTSDFQSSFSAGIPDGKIYGVVVPHAGYRYSGPVAAYGFNCVRGLQPDLVVVISPLHSMHRAPLLTTSHDAYETPLGLLPVEKTAVAQLNAALHQRLGTALAPIAHDSEHSLEIELPFLQHILGQFRLLPIMIRRQNKQIAQALGQALADILRGRSALLVASSDLSHFYSQQRAKRLDDEILRRLEAFDPAGVIDADDEGIGYACGRGAIAAVLWAARELGANKVNVLHHATSGDVTGDFSSVVGYGTAVIWEGDLN
ncbi:MAG: AmmeMemoRadiSam system protein B [Chloroflexi bacterium]|nr:AmmeMemoRadiSam system protein B [Chloroflexota bacterium]